jgi:hypothetical protein
MGNRPELSATASATGWGPVYKHVPKERSTIVDREAQEFDEEAVALHKRKKSDAALHRSHAHAATDGP